MATPPPVIFAGSEAFSLPGLCPTNPHAISGPAHWSPQRCFPFPEALGPRESRSWLQSLPCWGCRGPGARLRVRERRGSASAAGGCARRLTLEKLGSGFQLLSQALLVQKSRGSTEEIRRCYSLLAPTRQTSCIQGRRERQQLD